MFTAFMFERRPVLEFPSLSWDELARKAASCPCASCRPCISVLQRAQLRQGEQVLWPPQLGRMMIAAHQQSVRCSLQGVRRIVRGVHHSARARWRGCGSPSGSSLDARCPDARPVHRGSPMAPPVPARARSTPGAARRRSRCQSCDLPVRQMPSPVARPSLRHGLCTGEANIVPRCAVRPINTTSSTRNAKWLDAVCGTYAMRRARGCG